MKTYICCKVIHAVPTKMVNGCPWPEGLPLPDVSGPKQTDENCCFPIEVSIVDGYVFTASRDDKYPQFMTTEEFENTCRSTENMNFGDALVVLKQGNRVARKGWNGKDMYVFLAYEADFVTDADISAFDQLDVEVGDMLVMKTAQNTFQPGWLASQADMLAEDWYIVE